MAADPRQALNDLRDRIVDRSGGYLRNVVREYRVTCEVCSTPVDNFPRCFRCNEHRKEFGALLADTVMSLTYAVKDQQSGLLMRQYKRGYPETMRSQAAVLNQVLLYGLARHQRCISTRMGRNVDAYVTVPSLRDAPSGSDSPLTRITDRMPVTSDRLRLFADRMDLDPRTPVADRFRLHTEYDLTDAHIVVIDDTWTTGAQSQSAAITLRTQGGVRYVSILTVARWLDPEFPPTAQFIRNRLRSDYDPDICPVTGSRSCLPT